MWPVLSPWPEGNRHRNVTPRDIDTKHELAHEAYLTEIQHHMDAISEGKRQCIKFVVHPYPYYTEQMANGKGLSVVTVGKCAIDSQTCV